ncbi:uncharacterized protein LOC123213992 isoform X1 [Mangifera indica]|uniref:uncharacterized protein LOC123213992 isoform X1 n=1 Tax=Mangifera indica TaxID=29780 RepID=UPI001CFC1A8D|nr:uncharacterized protein LOC123213992 isoform X1 [Mangifera indica]
MASRLIVLLLLVTWFSSASLPTSADQPESGSTERSVVGQRLFMGFKETPRGSNRTFDCDPSGPCVPCVYSEKNDDKYRCSETGYRIPLKCVEIEGMKNENEQKNKVSHSTLETSSSNIKHDIMLHDADKIVTVVKNRSLLEDSSSSEGTPQAYITYRSCIPSINEEKLSVLDFESIVLCLLLISGSVVYLRRKRTAVMPGVGAGRIQANSRF